MNLHKKRNTGILRTLKSVGLVGILSLPTNLGEAQAFEQSVRNLANGISTSSAFCYADNNMRNGHLLQRGINELNSIINTGIVPRALNSEFEREMEKLENCNFAMYTYNYLIEEFGHRLERTTSNHPLGEGHYIIPQ